MVFDHQGLTTDVHAFCHVKSHVLVLLCRIVNVDWETAFSAGTSHPRLEGDLKNGLYLGDVSEYQCYRFQVYGCPLADFFALLCLMSFDPDDWNRYSILCLCVCL